MNMKGYNTYTIIVENAQFDNTGNPVILIDGICEQNQKKVRVPLTAEVFKFETGMDIAEEMSRTAALMNGRVVSGRGFKLTLQNYEGAIPQQDSGINPFDENYKDGKFFDDNKFKYAE